MMDTDSDLVLRYGRQGDRQALGTLFERQAPMAYRTALAVLRDSAEAEEAVQEAFLRLMKDAGAYDPERPFTPWLRGLVVHAALDRAKAARRRRDRELASASPLRRQEDPAMQAMDSEWKDRLRSLVDTLPEELRLPVALHYHAGCSYAEVAGALGCPEGTVASRLAEARQRLKAGLVSAGILLAAGLSMEVALADSAPQPILPPRLGPALEALARRQAAPAGPGASVPFKTKGLAAAAVLLIAGLLVWPLLHRTAGPPPGMARSAPSCPAPARQTSRPAAAGTGTAPALAVAPGTGTQAQVQPGPLTLRGRILYAETGLPVADVSIRVDLSERAKYLEMAKFLDQGGPDERETAQRLQRASDLIAKIEPSRQPGEDSWTSESLECSILYKNLMFLDAASEQELAQLTTEATGAKTESLRRLARLAQAHRAANGFGASARTDAQGAWSLTWKPGEAPEILVVESDRTRPKPYLLSLPAAPGGNAGNAWDLGEIRLQQAWGVCVRVLGPDGTPVPRAKLWISCPQRANFACQEGTGERIECRVPNLDQTPDRCVLSVEAGDCTLAEPLPLQGLPCVDGLFQAEVRLQQELVQGLTVGPNGRPEPCGLVCWREEARETVWQKESGPDGTFRFPLPPGKGLLHLSAYSKAGGGATNVSLAILPRAQEGLVLKLLPEESLRVRVLDHEGRPVAAAGYEVRLAFPPETDPYVLFSGKADAEGRIVLSLPGIEGERRYTLQVMTTETFGVLSLEQTSGEAELRLGSGRAKETP